MRTVASADALPSGGPLLVDHEGSLWLGTFVGLAQFPEPDTQHWGELDGVPSRHTISLSADANSLWLRTWRGAARLPLENGSRFEPASDNLGGIFCAGRWGIWIADDGELRRWDGERFAPVAIEGAASPTYLRACVEDAAGDLWLATEGAGLVRIPSGKGPPHAVQLDSSEPVYLLWIDADSRLYGATDERACRLQPVDARQLELRDCRELKPASYWYSAVDIGGGRTWLSTLDGLFQLDETGLHKLPGNDLRPGGRPVQVQQTAGGYWLTGGGTVERVTPCSDCEFGWRTLERVGEWQGLPGNSALSSLEQADGTIWVSGNRGVWRIPQRARSGPQRPPRIVPIRAHVAGREQPPDGPITVAPGRREISLEFARLSFRDRSLLRFRSRIGRDGAWSAPSREPTLQLAGLSPARYRIEMAASLDQVRWSDPAAIELRVLPAWHETWWARLAGFLAVFGVAVWIVRIRLSARLRLERERSRIAMDLHDELGSGLGSIGLMAGVATRDDIPASTRSRLAREIADQAALLGSGLRSLVWSLRYGEADAAELGGQIAAHVRRLFPDEHPSLRLEVDAEGRGGGLPADVRRHVLLLAMEALNNVARHAEATRVEVTFLAAASGTLHLDIADDGRGFDPDQAHAGVGLESMRHRATVCKAKLDIHSQPGGGCRIELQWPAPGDA